MRLEAEGIKTMLEGMGAEAVVCAIYNESMEMIDVQSVYGWSYDSETQSLNAMDDAPGSVVEFHIPNPWTYVWYVVFFSGAFVPLMVIDLVDDFDPPRAELFTKAGGRFRVTSAMLSLYREEEPSWLGGDLFDSELGFPDAEMSEVTGGWDEGYMLNNSGTWKHPNGQLFLFAEDIPPAEATMVTNNPIDLTAISTLVIEWTNAGYSGGGGVDNHSYLVVSKNKMGDSGDYEARLFRNSMFHDEIDSLDVSGLTGSYYIRVHARDDCDGAWNDSELRLMKLRAESPFVTESVPADGQMDFPADTYYPEGDKWILTFNEDLVDVSGPGPLTDCVYIQIAGVGGTHPDHVQIDGNVLTATFFQGLFDYVIGTTATLSLDHEQSIEGGSGRTLSEPYEVTFSCV